MQKGMNTLRLGKSTRTMIRCTQSPMQAWQAGCS